MKSISPIFVVVFTICLSAMSLAQVNPSPKFMEQVEDFLKENPTQDSDHEFELVSSIFKNIPVSSRQDLTKRLQDEIRKNPSNARAYFFLSTLEKDPLAKEHLQKAADLNAVYSQFYERFYGQKSPSDLAVMDITKIATAINSYSIFNSRYPKHQGAAEGIRPLLEPDQIKNMPTKDPWGNSYQYYCVDEDKGPFWIVSYGADGKPDQGLYEPSGKPKSLTPASSSRLEQDIIFSEDKFVRYPDDSKEWVPSWDESDRTSKEEDVDFINAGKYFDAADYQSAARLYDNYLQLHPEKKDKVVPLLLRSWFNLGLQNLRKGDCSRAWDCFTQARFTDDSDALAKSAQQIAGECKKKGRDAVKQAVDSLRFRP